MKKNKKKLHPRLLLVEGEQDKRVIPELIEANQIVWEVEGKPIVWIDAVGGYEILADPDTIATELAASQLQALGIIIDADNHPSRRWQSIRQSALKSIPDLPEDLPETGLIHVTSRGIRFGIWMMPNNQDQGILETFLSQLVPDRGMDLWNFAGTQARSAQTDHGAPYTPEQAPKAQIYTWLAWQNPPGRQLHQALTQKIFQPDHPHAHRFVTWFKALYNLS